MQEKSILLIIPYFGRFNNYFHLWLKSAEYNKSINFLLLSDNNINNLPNNIVLIRTTFEELRNKIQSLFSIEICLEQPYKLCDYRPFYYEIFEEYCTKYDFWGYCDIDLILGNLRTFLTDDILSRYDKILTRGHLSLYRTKKEIANIAKENIPTTYTWQDILKDSKSFAFDEWGSGKFDNNGVRECEGVSRIWNLKYKERVYDEIIFDDICTESKEFISAQKKGDIIDRKKLCCIFTFEEGHLFRSYIKEGKVEREETAYIHLQKRRMEIKTQSSEKYIIIPNQFVEHNNQPSTLYHIWNGRPRLYYRDKDKVNLKGFLFHLFNWIKQTLYTLRTQSRP